MRKTMLLLAVFGLTGSLFVMPLNAVAQTKTSGTVECGKNDLTHTIPVPDDKGFNFVIGNYKCTWTKPFVIEGLQSTQNSEVGFDEQMGTSGRVASSGFTQYKNGDKAFFRFAGTYDTQTMFLSGTWTYTRGTGKLLGIKGSGTSSRKMNNGGGSVCEVKGEYTLPAAK
jgi:hypothetical protein